MNTKFTPGPWKINRTWHLHKENEYYNITGGCGFWSLEEKDREKGLGITGVMSEPDARLIAAAPDLLAALQEAKKELRLLNVDAEGGQRRNTPANRVIELCEIAIKKATE